MKGLILAAGRGSRMRAETEDKPKCLVELAGKSLLEWQLLALSEAGVKPVAVVGGYRREDLTSASQAHGFAVLANPDWEKTNMVSTLLCAREWIGADTVIISYADIVYPAGHVRALMKSEAAIAITYDTEWEQLWRMRCEDPLADAETFRAEAGKLLEIGDKPKSLDQVQGQYMGLIKVAPEGWAAIDKQLAALGKERVAKTDMTALLRLLLSDGAAIGAVPVAGHWCEVDNGGDKEAYEGMLERGDWGHDWRV